MTNDRMIGIYLNDHLTGATAGVELIKRIAGSHKDGPYAATFERLVEEISADREALLQIMKSVGAAPAVYKTSAAWVVEKLGRLKPNGHLLSRSPLSSLVEVEVMQLGVQGKAAGWRTLLAHAAYDERLDVAGLQRLLDRAERQVAMLEERRPVMTAQAFVQDDTT